MSSAEGILSRAAYRSRQLVRSLRPKLAVEDLAEVERVLGPSLFPLFQGMSLRDQRHCLDVYRRLLAAGCADGDLLTAALLHDVGKGRGVRLWHRVAYVVLVASAPWLRPRFRGGLAALRDHPERGAALLAAAGAPPRVVELVRRHEDGAPTDHQLSPLQEADDSC